MANFEIYFPIFSETINTILKIFSQHDLRNVGRGYCKKKKKGVEIFGRNVRLGCLTAFKKGSW